MALQAVFDVDFKNGLTFVEIAPGATVDELRGKTGTAFKVSGGLKEITI